VSLVVHPRVRNC